MVDASVKEIASPRVSDPAPCQTCPMIATARTAIARAITIMAAINILPLAWSLFNLSQNPPHVTAAMMMDVIDKMILVVSVSMMPLMVAAVWLLNMLNKLTREEP